MVLAGFGILKFDTREFVERGKERGWGGGVEACEMGAGEDVRKSGFRGVGYRDVGGCGFALREAGVGKSSEFVLNFGECVWGEDGMALDGVL